MEIAQSTKDLAGALRSLMRGLEMVFWGLPMMVVVFVGSGIVGWFTSFGVVGPLIPPSLVCFGLLKLRAAAIEDSEWVFLTNRVLFLGLIMMGLAPFVYWWHWVPENALFNGMVVVLSVAVLVFLREVSYLIQRIAEGIGDPILCQDARRVCPYIRAMLTALIIAILGFVAAMMLELFPPFSLLRLFEDTHLGLLMVILMLVLVPLATTMAMIWKLNRALLEFALSRLKSGGREINRPAE